MKRAVNRLLATGDFTSREHRTAFAEAIGGPAGSGVAIAVGGGPGRAHPDLVNVNLSPLADVDVVADPGSLPYAAGTVDAVFCAGVLEHLESPERAVAEMFRVLAPGGRLFAVSRHLKPSLDGSGDRRSFTPLGHERLFRGAGFELVESGVAAGPTAAVTDLAAHYLKVVLPGRRLPRAAAKAAALALLPLRPLDLLVSRSTRAASLAASTWVHLRKPPLPLLPPGPLRLHVGSGSARLEGWVNVDMQALPGVDVVADVTQGLWFRDAEAIFAEHFLEHLPVDAALDFLLEAHRVLRPGGALRLSTPNLDWIWLTHYRFDAPPEEKRLAAVRGNRAFHGWQHQFLWNRELLGEALVACGFSEPRWCRYGESALAVFQGIERHATYADTAELPHVIIAEAHKAEPRPERLRDLRRLLERELLSQLKG